MVEVIKTDEPRFIRPGNVILKCVDGRWQDRDELPVAEEMLVTGGLTDCKASRTAS